MTTLNKILLPMAFLFSLSHAGGCLLTQSNDMNVSWKAYKTFAKLGVGGQFTSVKYTPNAKEGKNFKELLVGSSVEIDITKVNTKNPTRDKTLVDMFFKKLKGKTIQGKVTAIYPNKREKGKPYTGKLDISITMNEKTLTIPMSYHYDKEHFNAKGVIDLFDFEAKPALKSINKSCYDLHKGKTWSDVSIEFNTIIKASLCDVEVKK